MRGLLIKMTCGLSWPPWGEWNHTPTYSTTSACAQRQVCQLKQLRASCRPCYLITMSCDLDVHIHVQCSSLLGMGEFGLHTITFTQKNASMYTPHPSHTYILYTHSYRTSLHTVGVCHVRQSEGLPQVSEDWGTAQPTASLTSRPTHCSTP